MFSSDATARPHTFLSIAFGGGVLSLLSWTSHMPTRHPENVLENKNSNLHAFVKSKFIKKGKALNYLLGGDVNRFSKSSTVTHS